MATDYWLTFRIDNKQRDGRSPDDRRDALYDAVYLRSTAVWVEPTSFILFESNKSASVIATACKEAIAADFDVVLFRALDAKAARIIGKVDDLANLKAFIPYIRKV